MAFESERIGKPARSVIVYLPLIEHFTNSLLKSLRIAPSKRYHRAPKFNQLQGWIMRRGFCKPDSVGQTNLQYASPDGRNSISYTMQHCGKFVSSVYIFRSLRHHQISLASTLQMSLRL